MSYTDDPFLANNPGVALVAGVFREHQTTELLLI